MEVLKWGIFGVAVLCFLINCIFAVRSKRFLRLILLNTFLGIAALGLLYLTRKFTGFYLPINEWTVSASGIFGISGVVGMLVLPFVLL
jgi:pro-sigmaK processing inhibitor BofA